MHHGGIFGRGPCPNSASESREITLMMAFQVTAPDTRWQRERAILQRALQYSNRLDAPGHRSRTAFAFAGVGRQRRSDAPPAPCLLRKRRLPARELAPA